MINHTPVHDSLSQPEKKKINKQYAEYNASFGDSKKIILSERTAIIKTPKTVWKERRAIRLRRQQASRTMSDAL